jgi:transposase
VADFKRALFGAKSEKAHLLPGSRLLANDERVEQYELALEDIETALAAVHAEDEAPDPPKTGPKKRKPNRSSLPKHLPRIEEVVGPEDIICICGCERHVIGEDVSERLDIIPAQFRVMHCPAVHVYTQERGHSSPQVCLPVLRTWHFAGRDIVRHWSEDNDRALNRA